MKKIFLLALFALGLMTSCQKENYLAEDVNAGPGFEVTASLEDLAETKTQLAAHENGYKTLWSEEDAISVFYNGEHHRYLINEGQNSNVANFSWVGHNVVGGVEEGFPSYVFVGVYPYSTNVTVAKKGDDIIINTVIPSSQEYAEGSFSSNVSPMVGVNPNNVPVFPFKNVGSVLQLPLKGSATVVAASLESKAHKIAGNAVVTASPANNYIPTVSLENGVSAISLVCEKGIQLDPETPTNFHFVLAPGTYEANDLVIKFYDENGKYFETAITAENTFKRSKVHKFGVRTFVVNGAEEVDLWVKAQTAASMDADRIVPSITALNVCSWVKELKDQPNTKSLLEEAAANLALKNFKGVYDVLGGIPGFKKDVITFNATGVYMEKVDYTGAAYLKSFIGDINNINDIESLLDFIREFDKLYAAFEIEDKLNEVFGNIENLIDKYVSNGTIRSFLKNLLGNISDFKFVDMLEKAVADPNSFFSKILNGLFSQEAFLNFVKSTLTTVVEGIESASKDLIDSSNTTIKEAAINLARINALANARIDAADKLWAAFDKKNAEEISVLDAFGWGIFKKVLNSKVCVDEFTKHDMLDIYNLLTDFVKTIEDLVSYDKGSIVYEKEWDEYQQDVDWWILSFNE